jgi:hypothetical protein
MKDVEERLLRAFNNVKSKQVAGVIKRPMVTYMSS